MNTDEIYNFALWLKENISILSPKYDALRAVLQHNSTQAAKQPLEERLETLIDALNDTPLYLLSNQQLKLLEAYDVDEYFGSAGVNFVDNVIKKSTFDPATATSDFQSVVQHLATATTRADALIEAFRDIEDWTLDEPELDEDRIIIRLEFREDASISNMVEWKHWANKWHDIVRGIAIAVGEAPEDVHVLGASKGSIIMTLATTYAVAHLLGNIFKIVIKRAGEVIQLSRQLEDLRRKKLLNNQLEKAFKERAKEIKQGGTEEATEAVKKLKKKKNDGGVDTALSKSVKELFDFCEKGGDLDFISPASPEDNDDSGEEDSEAKELVNDLRKMIENIRKNKQVLLLPPANSDQDDVE